LELLLDPGFQVIAAPSFMRLSDSSADQQQVGVSRPARDFLAGASNWRWSLEVITKQAIAPTG
jgi:hypothetical protein